MTGTCPNCGHVQSVHRAAWLRLAWIPKCNQCGTKLRPDNAAKRTVASRKKEARKGIVADVQNALDRGVGDD